MSNRVCKHGPIWSRCGLPALSSCVYCGRPFCKAHGRRGAEGLDVCDRSRCMAKAEDLERHKQYLADVDQRNRVGLCGHPGCEVRYGGSCSSCNRFYCVEHVLPREDVLGIGQERFISACDHCWSRRKLWRRRG